MNKIRKGDEVVVITGRDKNRRGHVIAVRADQRILVGGLNMVKKHVKPNPNQGIAGGVIFVWVIFTVMNVFIANDFFSILNDKIATSYLGKYLYDNNLIWNIIKNNLFMR